MALVTLSPNWFVWIVSSLKILEKLHPIALIGISYSAQKLLLFMMFTVYAPAQRKTFSTCTNFPPTAVRRIQLYALCCCSKQVAKAPNNQQLRIRPPARISPAASIKPIPWVRERPVLDQPWNRSEVLRKKDPTSRAEWGTEGKVCARGEKDTRKWVKQRTNHCWNSVGWELKSRRAWVSGDFLLSAGKGSI